MWSMSLGRMYFRLEPGLAHLAEHIHGEALGIVVAVVLVVVAVIGANARRATHHSDSHYHGQHERRNEQRKPDRTMVVGMPSDHGEQQDRDKQHDVAPVAFLVEYLVLL